MPCQLLPACPGVEMRGSPPLAPPHFVCVETFTLPYLTWYLTEMCRNVSFDLVLTDTKQRPPSTEKRLRVADVRVKCQKNAPGITIDPVDKAPQSRRSGAGVEASIDASTVALQRPKTGA